MRRSTPTVQLPPGYSLDRCDPGRLSPSDVDAAVDLLREGAAVDVDTARAELPAATTVCFLYHCDELVGLGAIKKERQRYAHRVQLKSHFSFDPRMLELGYVVVRSDHSRKGLSSRIVEALLATHPGQLFATTDQDAMKSALGHRGFVRHGNEWTGKRGRLSLWIRC